MRELTQVQYLFGLASPVSGLGRGEVLNWRNESELHAYHLQRAGLRARRDFIGLVRRDCRSLSRSRESATPHSMLYLVSLLQRTVVSHNVVFSHSFAESFHLHWAPTHADVRLSLSLHSNTQGFSIFIYTLWMIVFVLPDHFLFILYSSQIAFHVWLYFVLIPTFIYIAWENNLETVI
jgi:hypothetical protein